MLNLPSKAYQDRVRGAWAGQVVGAAYAAHWNSNNQANANLKLASAELGSAAAQSFFHVQIAFLQTMEKFGRTATRAQAGAFFGATEFALSHAGEATRRNLRRGMMPNYAGHPRFNPHSDDSDFQAAAAVLGLVTPGSPRAAAKLSDLFGGMMSYGDGQYGGQFLATVYAQAALENGATPATIERCLRAGLSAVHPNSAYAAVGREALEHYHGDRNDWRKAKAAISARWGADDLCPQGAHEPANFDAKFNGGLILIALLYGQGDLARSLEIVAACGQQVRENAAAAAGVLGTLLGFEKLSSVAGIDESSFGNVKFGDLSFPEVVSACERVARIQLSGDGLRTIEEGQAFRISMHAPEAPGELQQMHAAFNRKQLLQWNGAATAAFFDKMPLWDADWELVSTGYDGAPSVRKFQGKSAVLVTHPVDKVEPAILQRAVTIPMKNPRLLLTVASFPDAVTDDKKSPADWLLRVLVNGKPILEKVIDTEDRWDEITVDLSRYAGKLVILTMENAPGGQLEFAYETAYWSRAAVVGD